MSKQIKEFRKEYRFLSNFFPVKIVYEGIEYPSAEHAYQAAKTSDRQVKHYIADLIKPGDAKKFGKTINLKSNWYSERIQIMRDILKLKFQDKSLRDYLLETGDTELIEGNYWGDTFWGVCNGQGENWLGKIIMEIRSEIQKEV